MGVVAIAFAAYLYRIWDSQFSVLIADWSPDAYGGGALIKNLHSGGWILTNPHLGAPFNQQSYDFPQAGETLQMLGVKFLSLFSGRPYLVMNVYYLLGFGVLASVTYLVLRHLRLGPAVSAAIALTYTFLGYHFLHEQGHLYRSAYVSGPLGVVLIFWALSWRSWFLRDGDAPLRPWSMLRGNLRWRRVVGALLLSGALGVTETIGTALVLVGLAVACLIAAARDHDPGTIVAGAVVGSVMLATFALAMSPNLWYWHEHGTNRVASTRQVTDQEVYGLKIDAMMLPDPNSYIGVLRGPMREAQAHSPIQSEGGQTLGVVGAAGFLALLYWALRDWGRAEPSLGHRHRRNLRANAGVLALIMALFGTISGFAILLSLAGFAQVRTWNRVVIIIAFCALLAVGLALERALRWTRRHVRRAVVADAVSVLVLVAVFAVNFWSGPVPERQTAATVDEVQVLQNLGHKVDTLLPAGSAVFQLPIVRYPENGPLYRMEDYSEILPYVFTDDLRWSYGAMKGRPEADWQLKIDSQDPTTQLPGLRGLGFDAILVDTYGYADGGAAITARLDTTLGPPSVQSVDGRWRLWDLRHYAEARHLTTSQLRDAATALVGGKLIGRVPVTSGAPPG